nr:hypothetical protein [Lachnospiraceae bacterium]
MNDGVKKLTAGLLSAALLITSLPQGVMAYSAKDGPGTSGVTSACEASRARGASSASDTLQANGASYGENHGQMREDMLSAIREGLEKEDTSLKEEYPEGIYSIANLTAAVEETNSDPLVLYLVRHGGTDGDSTVHMKLSDYSAEYGKDYYVKLKDSFFSKAVEKNEDSQPLFYQFGDEDGDSSDPDYDALKETYGEEAAGEIMNLLNEQALKDAGLDEDAAPEGDEEAISEKLDSLDITGLISGETDGDTASAEESATAEKTSAAVTPAGNITAAAETTGDTALAGESATAYAASDGSDSAVPNASPLEAMNRQVSQYTGQDTVLPIQEQELSPEDQATVERNARLQDLLFPGTEFDVEFRDGEQIREIYVYPVNNDYSDGDRVFEMRIDVGDENKNICYEPGENSVAVTIEDDEPNETAVLSVATDVAEADKSGYTEVVLKRDNALYKVSSVDYKVEEEKSKTVVASGKAVFMPGMDTRTLKLQLGNVTGSTAEKLSFTISDAIGGEVSGDDSASISLTKYKANLSASSDTLESAGSIGNSGVSSDSLKETGNSGISGESSASSDTLAPVGGENGVIYEKDSPDNPLGIGGTLYSNYFQVDMDDDNFYFKHNNECDDYLNEFNDGRIHLKIPDHSGKCKWQAGFAVLDADIYPVMFESLDFNWCANNFEKSKCNRVFVGLKNYSFDWNESEELVMAHEGDIDTYEHDLGDCSPQRSNINLTTGALTNLNQDCDWKNEYMNFTEKFKNDRSAMKKTCPFCIGVEKTSGGKNGMGLLVYDIKFYLKNFDVTICSPEYLEGRNDELPGRLFFDDNQTNGDYSSLSKINFIKEDADFAYLKGIEISPDKTSWTAVDSSCFDSDSLVLNLSKEFFGKYGDCVEYSSDAKFYLRPVYDYLTVPVTIVPDENGGISVTDSLNGTTEIPRGTANQKVLRCNVGDTLTVRSYDVSTGDSNGTYSFTEFDMTPTAVNGGGDTSQHYKVYSSDPASIAIENCNYTLSPVYTHTGTKVNIEIKGTVPEGCGLNAKVRDSQGNTVNKTEYTYEEDKIRSGQILTVKADVADGYRAKWTIMSKGHENYGLTCYGDTLYYKIMSPEGKIYLTFEKMENPVYTTITGKVGTYDGSILNPPAQGEGGEWLSAYVPVANVSVQMGSFSGLSGQDGSFALYSHTEAADDSTQSVSGENVTTYLKLPAGVESEKHSMLVIRNGVRQCVYADVTAVSEYDPGSLSHNGLADNTPSVLKSSDLVVDFYGNGPIPVGYYSLVGNVGELEDPSIRVNAPAVELRNYSIGFHVELASVTDENGKDLVDRVKFIIFHKDGSQGNTYTVDRTNEGQTVYEFLNYQGKDSDGKDMVVNLNGLTDLLSGDQVYVEIEGSVKADSGETVPYSYGMYRSGSTFVEVPGEGEEIAFPDISSGTGSDQWGIPTLDVLGTMLPTLKFGKFSVKAEVTSSYLVINVGFDVAKLNKSLYDTREAERAEKAAAVKKDLDENNAELEAAKKTKAEADQKIQELESKTTLTHEEEDELIKNEQISTEMAKQIDALEQVVTDLNKQYEDLGGTTEVQPQEDPLKPADVNDAADKVDTKAEFTAEEISSPGKASTDSFSSDNAWSPFSDSAKQMIEKIKKDSASLGTKGDSFKGTGSVSFNMNVTIGISVRFAVKANDQGRGEWCFDYATVYLSVAGALTAMYYMVFPEFPVPLYAGLSATASVGMYNGMTTAANAKIPISQFDEDEYDENQILYHGMIPITFGLEGFVGAGLRNLLCLEMGLGFLQKFNFAWDVGYDGLDSKQSGSGMTSFYGYLSTTLLFFSYKWKFLQANWKYQLYSTYVDFDDDGKTMSPVSSDMQPGDPALSDFTVNEPLKVNYYDEEGLPVYGNTLEWDGTTTVAEGLTDTISDVVYLDDGSFLAAYEGTLSSNDFVSGINEDNYKYNSRAIYLTWYDGENAVTCILQKDGTNDSSLHMEDLGDKVIISFASSDRIFEASDLLDDDGNVLSNALPKVLSSMDMYAVVLDKSYVEYFVTEATADERLSMITRLTDDQADKTNITGLSSKLSIGADYLGYGYENGQAELIGDQIYLFYTAVDYNQWAGMEEITDLSDIIDAKGYEVYRIYDINNDKWTDTYASVIKKVAAKAAGMAEGARLADIHLGAQGGATTLLPRIGELDTVAVEVDGAERLAMAYIIEQDQQVSGNTSGGGADQAALFLAFMTPAEIDYDGTVTKEPSWSLPLQMNEEYASITNPSFVKVTDGVDTNVYFMFGKDNDLKYMKLSDMLKEIGDTALEESYSYRIINKGEITLSGNAIDYYYFDEDSTPDPSTAIYGGDDNKFSLRNGYRIASDDAGHIYAVWAQSEGNGQKLYISTMSSVDGRTYWSEPAPMDYGDDSQILENPSFCVADNGDMLIAHNAYALQTIVEQNSEGRDVAAGQKHVDDAFCLTKQKAVGSAGIDSIILS